MKGEPDDPTNPHRRRPPALGRKDPEHGSIARLVRQADNEMEATGGEMTNMMRDFMGMAFCAETNMKPSEIVLVNEDRPDGRTVCWFEPRGARDPKWQKENAELRKVIDRQEDEIEALKSEILDLKRKARR